MAGSTPWGRESVPDTPRYVTHRSGLYVQVLDLAPVQDLAPARTVATCPDNTTAALVALALNAANENDVAIREAE